MKELGRLIAPSGPGIVINNQQNSVYGNIGKEAINAEWTDARAAAADGV